MKLKQAVVGLAAALAIPAAFASTANWEIDPAHSNAQFVVRHLGISNVQGEFTKVSGTVQLDDQDISKSSVTASIEVNSVDTRVADRDTDLKSNHFFDAAKYPAMSFQSTKIWKTGEGTAQMTGNLTIHGVTREVTFDVTGPSAVIKDPWGNHRRGVSATTKINRQDFGLTYYTNKMVSGDMLIGDQVSITIDIEIVQK
jgi:polyisoprenoid-binding protein YceI